MKKCSIVLLDYHSEDGLQEYINYNYQEYLDDGMFCLLQKNIET